MNVSAYPDSSPAAWLLNQGRAWYDLTARGPLGFQRYARLRFIPDPDFIGQHERDANIPDLGEPGPSETWQIGVVITHLKRHTTTPNDCYYLMWEGWPDLEPLATQLDAARVDINDETQHSVRGYYLFRGDTDLHAWDNDTYSDATSPLESRLPVPAFVWPADRAWCIVRDVDPHIATIGASTAAITEVLSDPRIDTVDDPPDIDPPRYW